MGRSVKPMTLEIITNRGMKIDEYLFLGEGNGKIGVEAYFGHSPLTSSIEYGCENHFLGLKSHPESFKHVKFNEF